MSERNAWEAVRQMADCHKRRPIEWDSTVFW